MLRPQMVEQELGVIAVDKAVVNPEITKPAETKQVEHEAILGRYMLDMRHSLNNALTSILGNAELILLDPQSLSPNLKLQVETIRNMGMRVNEIMQRLSSLQKELQLVEQQGRTKSLEKAAAAGV
jgi:signal transduction histidine kinase